MTDGGNISREDRKDYLPPEKLAEMAEELCTRGNIGVAFTYNEPTVCYEYVLDTSKLLKKRALKSVLVTNGCVEERIAKEILPYIDALNIDLKCFDRETYTKTLGEICPR